MTSWVALLRGVNVGGHRKLPMAELRAALTARGYRQVRTLLASGNIVLDAADESAAALEARLEADLEEAAGVRTDVIVRAPAEWAALIAANPFPAEAEAQPSRLVVVVMKGAADRSAADTYLKSYAGDERVAMVGRDVFVFYGDGMGNSKLATGKFGLGTARNWNTVRKLGALLGE